MPRLRQVPRDSADDYARKLYTALFGDRDPVAQPGTATGADAAALATAQGAWGAADDAGATIFRFGADGRFLMAEAKPYLEATQEQSGGELGWFDLDTRTGRLSTLLELDTNLTSGTSHPGEGDPALSIGDTAIGSAGFSLPRLRDDRTSDPTSLVGLWALNSPTDLSVAHLAFFANGRAMFLTQEADADCLGRSAPGECPPGVEYASYTWDAATGTVVFNLLDGESTLSGGQRLLHYDTNGCGGLFETCATAVANGQEDRSTTIVLTLAADGRSATTTRGNGTIFTLYRVPTRGLGAVAVLEDTYVRAEFPNMVSGNDAMVVLYRDDNEEIIPLYRFPVQQVTESFTRAYLNLALLGCPAGRGETTQAEVYRVTGDWNESTVSWTSRPGIDFSENWGVTRFVASPIGSPSAGFVKIDITSLVRAWQEGRFPNHGLALDRRLSSGPDCNFHSAESSAQRPFVSLE